MQIKVMTHQVRDSLFVVSSDLKENIERGLEPSENLHEILFRGLPEIVEDKMLPNMTVMVPDRAYFDKKIDFAINNMQMFADSYLMD